MPNLWLYPSPTQLSSDHHPCPILVLFQCATSTDPNIIAVPPIMEIAISIQEKLHPVLPCDRTYRINSLCIEVNIFSIPGHLHLFKIVSTRMIGIREERRVG